MTRGASSQANGSIWGVAQNLVSQAGWVGSATSRQNNGDFTAAFTPNNDCSDADCDQKGSGAEWERVTARADRVAVYQSPAGLVLQSDTRSRRRVGAYNKAAALQEEI